MGNDQEYEGEKEQPVPHPPASDMPIDTQQLPVDQLDHGSPSRPVPMDKDEPIPSENGNLPSQAEAVDNDNNMELKCSTVESHSEAPSSHNSLESRSSLQQSETEAVLSDNKFGKPHESQIEAVPNNKSAELKNNAQQPVIESVLEDNGATATIQQSQQKRVFINNNVQMNSGTQQSQTGAVPNVENVELEASPQNPEIEMSPNANGVDLKANLKQRQTEAAPSYNNVELKSGPQKLLQGSPSSVPLDDGGSLLNPESQSPTLQIPKASETYNCRSKTYEVDCSSISTSHIETDKPPADAKIEPSEVPESTPSRHANTLLEERSEPDTPHAGSSSIKSELETKKELKDVMNKTDTVTPASNGNSSSKQSFLFDEDNEGSESGTEEEQWEFMKELENFFRERSMEFKPPKFYGEGLNCLKLWRAVMKLGGYDKVTSCKLWRQVGESFRPPKTCTTVSWTFRGFYEKALLEYERHKTHGGELNVPLASSSEPMNVDNQGSASGRARRDAAARAMQGWHSQRLLGNGEVSDPIIKDKNSTSLQKREKQLKSLGLLKRKKPSDMEDAVKAARTKSSKSQLDVEVVDLGPPADWVKINVQRTKDCFEVYALVPGLLREEVRVQSDPAGRLVIRGDPEHPDNPWGVTPFKKVVSLPSRIDPHQTSAVVTLHGQLFIRVPFELSD